MKLQAIFAFFYMLLGVAAEAFNGTATHYNLDQGGRPACLPGKDSSGNWKKEDKKEWRNFEEGKYCGAPNDGSPWWPSRKCSCGADDPDCKKGECDDCCKKSDCTKGCPDCNIDGFPDPAGLCGKRLKITCIDPKACWSPGACVVIEVTNVCPSNNPCNVCKATGMCKDK